MIVCVGVKKKKRREHCVESNFGDFHMYAPHNFSLPSDDQIQTITNISSASFEMQ